MPVYAAHQLVQPDLNIYLYTKGSSSSVDTLNKVIRGNFRKEMISAFDYDDISNAIEKIFNEFNDNDEHVLNFTGGTKIMSLAAFNTFTRRKFRSLYVDTENRYYYYFRSEEPVSKNQLNLNISLKDYLALKDQKFHQPEYSRDRFSEDEKNKISNLLGSEFGYFNHFLMNFAQKYDDNKINQAKEISYPEVAHRRGPASGSEIIYRDKQTTLRLVLFNKLKYENTFPGKEMLSFLRGEWFERFVFQQLEDLKIFNELYKNIKIEWKTEDGQKGYEKNEIDIIGLTGIYPFIIEVKAGRNFNFTSGKSYSQVNSAINKLSTLKINYCSTYSQLIFVFPSVPQNQRFEERLREANIKCFDIRNIQKIKDLVQRTNVNL